MPRRERAKPISLVYVDSNALVQIYEVSLRRRVRKDHESLTVEELKEKAGRNLPDSSESWYQEVHGSLIALSDTDKIVNGGRVFIGHQAYLGFQNLQSISEVANQPVVPYSGTSGADEENSQRSRRRRRTRRRTRRQEDRQDFPPNYKQALASEAPEASAPPASSASGEDSESPPPYTPPYPDVPLVQDIPVSMPEETAPVVKFSAGEYEVAKAVKACYDAMPDNQQEKLSVLQMIMNSITGNQDVLLESIGVINEHVVAITDVTQVAILTLASTLQNLDQHDIAQVRSQLEDLETFWAIIQGNFVRNVPLASAASTPFYADVMQSGGVERWGGLDVSETVPPPVATTTTTQTLVKTVSCDEYKFWQKVQTLLRDADAAVVKVFIEDLVLEGRGERSLDNLVPPGIDAAAKPSFMAVRAMWAMSLDSHKKNNILGLSQDINFLQNVKDGCVTFNELRPVNSDTSLVSAGEISGLTLTTSAQEAVIKAIHTELNRSGCKDNPEFLKAIQRGVSALLQPRLLSILARLGEIDMLTSREFEGLGVHIQSATYMPALNRILTVMKKYAPERFPSAHQLEGLHTMIEERTDFFDMVKKGRYNSIENPGQSHVNTLAAHQARGYSTTSLGRE